MNNAIIRTQELSKWFGEVVALNSLSVEIGPGVTGLLGPNGAGKSTFIKLVLGLYQPSKGMIEVFGQAPRNNLAVLRRIAYCPETDQFFENSTGFEFVYWLSRYTGMGARAARRAAEAACERVRIAHRMHDPIEEYSKGMRQRIKIAQALALDPELLFLDEPMAGLDPEGREEIFELARGLGEEGRSVIVSSHILYEIERVTDDVVLIHHGSMLAQGKVREIRELIDEHPHTVTVTTDTPRALAGPFAEQPGTMSIEFTPRALVIRTRDPNACYDALNQLALRPDTQIGAIECADDNLQAVFDYLTE